MANIATRELAEKACREIWEEIDSQAKESGIDLRYLFTKLKEELESHVTKTIKLKGAVRENELPAGRKIVSRSGIIIFTKDGEEFGDGESVIEWDEISWDIRQRARMDAHRLLNHYPAEKKDVKHEGNIHVEVVSFYGNGHKPKKKTG